MSMELVWDLSGTGVFNKWLDDKRLGFIMYARCLVTTQVGPHYSLALGLFLAGDALFRQEIKRLAA